MLTRLVAIPFLTALSAFAQQCPAHERVLVEKRRAQTNNQLIRGTSYSITPMAADKTCLASSFRTLCDSSIDFR